MVRTAVQNPVGFGVVSADRVSSFAQALPFRVLVAKAELAEQRMGADGRARKRRVRGISEVARAVGISLALAFGVATAFGAAATGIDELGAFAAALPLVVLAIRSMMLGVWIQGTDLLIVSWLRSYRIARDEDSEVMIGDYSGGFNRWADGDPMSRHVSVLALAIGRNDRLFPATAMRNSTARKVIPEIEQVLGVPSWKELDARL